MASNIFGPPGVSDGVEQIFPTTTLPSPAVGSVIILTEGTEFGFIIQSYTIEKGERIQEVRTLADTSHLYTFGKTLPRIRFNGMFINPSLSPLGARKYEARRGGMSTLDRLFSTWDTAMRAKSIGQNLSFPIEVDLQALKTTFFGVGVDLNVTSDINLESMVSASFTLIVMKEERI